MRTAATFLRIPIALYLAPLLTGAFVSRADAADVRVDAIMVQPASPGPSTLCELKVRLKNAGSRSISYLRFNVKINGQDEPVYKPYMYVVNIDPGTAGELALNNFYSPPEAKAFEIQVTLDTLSTSSLSGTAQSRACRSTGWWSPGTASILRIATSLRGQSMEGLRPYGVSPTRPLTPVSSAPSLLREFDV